MFEVQHPFFRPMWRRVALVAACFGWAVFEVVAGSSGWALLFAAAGAWFAHQFFIAWSLDDEDGKDEE